MRRHHRPSKYLSALVGHRPPASFVIGMCAALSAHLASTALPICHLRCSRHIAAGVLVHRHVSVMMRICRYSATMLRLRAYRRFCELDQLLTNGSIARGMLCKTNCASTEMTRSNAGGHRPTHLADGIIVVIQSGINAPRRYRRLASPRRRRYLIMR